MVKFLFVDHSTVMRQMIASTMHKGGVFNPENAVIFEASDAQEALKVFKEQSPHIVLSDSDLPKTSGLELAHEIRKLDAKVPIFILTTEEHEKDILTAVSSGVATGCIIKPLKPGVLEENMLKAFQALKSDTP